MGKVALVLLGGVFVLYAAAVGLAGGSFLGLALYPLAFLLVVELPGLYLCELLLPKATPGERAVIALPVGSVLLMLCFSLLGWTGVGWVAIMPCVCVSATYLLGKAIRRGTGLAPKPEKRAPITAPGWAMVMLFAAGLFLYVWIGVFYSGAKAGSAGNMVYNQDLMWSVGNASAAAYGMPVRDMRAAGGVMHYHYLSDILCGLVGLASGQSAWDAVCFYNWPIFFAGLCGALYLVSKRFGARGWAALVAPVGALFAHFAWDASFKHIFQNVNGVLQNYQYLAAAVLVMQLAEGENGKRWKPLLAFAAATTALVWSKSTVGLLFVCAVLAAFAVRSLLARRVDKWLLAGGLLGLAAFGALYALVYSGAINNLIFQPTVLALYDAFRILATMYLPGLVLYAVSLYFSLRDFKSLSGAALAVNAMVPGGILAYVLFYHYSFSQSYFLLAASFAMWLCVARVATQMARIKPLRWGALGLCAVGVAASLYYAAPVLRRGAQVSLRCAGLRPSLPAEVETVTPDDAAAADFLRQNMGPGEVFATNRNEKNPDAQEGVFHYYTAASSRQAYVESWRYAMDYSLDYDLLRHNLEKVSDGVFAAATWQEAQALAAQNGIDYLLVYLPGGHAFEGGTPVFTSDTVLVYRI